MYNGRMSFFQRRTVQAHPDHPQNGKRNDDTAHSLDWEFGSDGLEDLFTPAVDLNRFGAASASPVRRQDQVITVLPTRKPTAPPALDPLHPASSLTQAFRGANATAQVTAVRNALDRALEQWWGQGELPVTELLRDGLLVLEAGGELGESQRSLLLRTALARGKGVITALRHQTDSERTAALLKEALFDRQATLVPIELRQLRERDEKSDEWAPLLSQELTSELPTIFGHQRQLALAGLAELTGKNAPTALFTLPFVDDARLSDAKLPWSRFRIVLLAVLLCLLSPVYLWRHGQSAASEVVAIPAGQYTIGYDATEATPSGEARRTVELDAFALDQTEVTNRNYRLCYQANHCAQPDSKASATRHDYFSEPAFDNFPVVNVSWENARTFCQWVGKRLPTVDEWDVAAGFAPVTRHYYRFPWGEQFQPQLTNSLATSGKDTQTVGLYHPQGDSPFGLMDMAGNVAEWTATSPNADGNYVVKGGSFQDQPEALHTMATQTESGATVATWLGFRCADTLGN